jgi:hypothetical protein
MTGCRNTSKNKRHACAVPYHGAVTNAYHEPACDIKMSSSVIGGDLGHCHFEVRQ